MVPPVEKGKLSTALLSVSAIGMPMPLYLVFPYSRFQDHFLNGRSTGIFGGANPSAWMTAEFFIDFLKL